MMDLDDYYVNQSGTGLSGFEGLRYHQVGGSFFGRLFKGAILPLLKYVGKSAVRTGVNVADDILQGKNYKEAIKGNLKETARTMTADAKKRLQKSQKGEGKRRRRKKTTPTKSKDTATKPRRRRKRSTKKTPTKKKKKNTSKFPFFDRK